MSRTLIAILALFTLQVQSQINCNLFKWKNDTVCYKACNMADTASEMEQGSAGSQKLFDKAIALCPTYAFAYFEKSVPYLKRGEFVTWKKMIDIAVRLSPADYLGYRGWCRFQFLRDYMGAIRDIDSLRSIVKHDIGYSINGDYHLAVAQALCYKGIGDHGKALQLIEKKLRDTSYLPGIYDYLHVGVLKLDLGDHKGAIVALKKQITINDYLAETYYYLARAYKKLGDRSAFELNIGLAKQYYLGRRRRTDPYTEPLDKIYLSDIEAEIKGGS